MESSTLFKIATEPDEFEQIHRLNYQTFVEEIPQHSPNPEGRHVDKFHAENTYLVGVRDGRIIAQLAIRRRRPFSLDGKLPRLDAWLPSGHHPVELRLLAVASAHRNGPVPAQLLQFAARHCLDRGDDLAVISGAVRRLRFYRALGFEAFGPLVGTQEAPYQPMFLTLGKFVHATETRRSLRGAADGVPVAKREPVNLLPGPVTVSPAVRAALARPAVSHRSPEFLTALAGLRRRLAALVQANDVQILPGSGSLANDLVAAQLTGLRQPGVIVSTGEFGERLADQARRAKLDFHWARLPWGAPLTPSVLEDAVEKAGAPGWLWLVHHETSTGVLHDLGPVKALARERKLFLCLDCISTVGAVTVDLGGVQLASGVSGKGLAAMPGLALVFHQTRPAPRPDLPRYLDLGLWAAAGSAPFTHSSNLMAALDAAVAEVERLRGGRCEQNNDAAWLRAELRTAGFALTTDEAYASPIIVTVQLPPEVRAAALGAALEQRGFLISYRSGYIERRNWIQFALMTPPPRSVLAEFLGHLRELAAPAVAVAAGDAQNAPSQNG